MSSTLTTTCPASPEAGRLRSDPGRIAIASRSISKCQAIIDSVQAKGGLKQPGEIKAYALDAMDVEATKALIRETESQIVINVGSAFLNMSVLRACIDTGAAYLDTAIHEEPGKICETPPWPAAAPR